MNRVRIFTVFLIALLAGGGLAFGTYDYLQNVPVKTVTVPTRRVVVAGADLTIGAELRRDDLATIDWPASAAPEGAFEDPAALVGRGLIASIVKNEPILPGKLASKEAGSGLPPIIPNGKRAMSVRVNEVIGVAGYVLPGTHVDVVATASTTSRAEDMTSKVVLSNVEVLAAGTRLESDSKDSKPVQVTVVTLLVTPEQAERLSLVSTEGKIQLALRNPLDLESPETSGARPGLVLGGVAPPQRPVYTGPRRASAPSQPSQTLAPAAPAPTVEIIRGDKRSHVVVG
ncbi:MAG TPA: Flp pilus assembly protein CpaB [Vicinamibacterales bacterium]|nr:Flp pilus assembly protein CpaB [Vicinamibacterales bacterium]